MSALPSPLQYLFRGAGGKGVELMAHVCKEIWPTIPEKKTVDIVQHMVSPSVLYEMSTLTNSWYMCFENLTLKNLHLLHVVKRLNEKVPFRLCLIVTALDEVALMTCD